MLLGMPLPAFAEVTCDTGPRMCARCHIRIEIAVSDFDLQQWDRSQLILSRICGTPIARIVIMTTGKLDYYTIKLRPVYAGVSMICLIAAPNLGIVCARISTIRPPFRPSVYLSRTPSVTSSNRQLFLQQKGDLAAEDRAVEMSTGARAHGSYEITQDSQIL